MCTTGPTTRSDRWSAWTSRASSSSARRSEPIPAAPGRPERFDHEYVRNGVMNLFMITMPLLGWRAVQVTDRRTMLDFAEVIRWLVEEVHEEAEKVVLVMDNLNTHKIASLYEAFPPEQARRIAEKLEIHFTPKHGSWLNMAEIELSVLARQCLAQRIETKEDLERHVVAWEEERNERGDQIKWRFRDIGAWRSRTTGAHSGITRLVPQRGPIVLAIAALAEFP